MKLLRRTSLLGSDGSRDVHLLRGTAEVVLVEGRNLAIRDSCGTSDPYVILRLGDKKYSSTIKYKTLNPVWKEKFTFQIHADEALHCDVWDKDKFLRDDPLGNVVLHLGKYASTQVVDVWVPLENVECGELHFQILYRTFADDLQKSFQAIEMLPLQIASLVATPIMWTEAGKCKQALADHLASLVNNEEWADVEFVLDADGDKRIFGHSAILASRCPVFQSSLPKSAARKRSASRRASSADVQLSGEFGFSRNASPKLETITGMSSSRLVPTTESPESGSPKHHRKKEKRRARVLIKEHKADVFLAMLHFLYTGAVPSVPCFGYTLRKQEEKPEQGAAKAEEPPKPPVRWTWFADPDWADFEPEVNDELEKAYQQAVTANDGNSIRVRVDSERFVEVRVGSSLYQKRYDDESRQRSVKREDPSVGSSEQSSSSSSSTPTDRLSQFNAQQLMAKQDLDVRLAKIAIEYSLSDAFVLQCENAIRFGEYSLTELPVNLVDDLKKAIETTDYAQVTVVVADDADESVHHEVLAHPCFLALSPFFRAILQSGMKEAQEKRIELTEVTRDCFLLVLEFLHTGLFAKFPTEYALEMLRISDQYDISPHLRQMIEQFIATHLLESHNAIAIYHYAVLNNAANLEATALAAIKRNAAYPAWTKRNREALATLNPTAHQTVFGS